MTDPISAQALDDLLKKAIKREQAVEIERDRQYAVDFVRGYGLSFVRIAGERSEL